MNKSEINTEKKWEVESLKESLSLNRSLLKTATILMMVFFMLSMYLLLSYSQIIDGRNVVAIQLAGTREKLTETQKHLHTLQTRYNSTVDDLRRELASTPNAASGYDRKAPGCGIESDAGDDCFAWFMNIDMIRACIDSLPSALRGGVIGASTRNKEDLEIVIEIADNTQGISAISCPQ